MKRRVSAQALVLTTHRQPPGPWTGRSTPRGRNWQDPSPKLSEWFLEAGSIAGSPGSAAGRPAAGGRPAGSSQQSLKNMVEQVYSSLTCGKRSSIQKMTNPLFSPVVTVHTENRHMHTMSFAICI